MTECAFILDKNSDLFDVEHIHKPCRQRIKQRL
jgi:hypothetical protein